MDNKIIILLLATFVFVHNTSAKHFFKCNPNPNPGRQFVYYNCTTTINNDFMHDAKIRVDETKNFVEVSTKHVKQILTTRNQNGPGPGRPLMSWSNYNMSFLVPSGSAIESVDQLYSNKNQRFTFQKQCGRAFKEFIQRGHLAANADYTKDEYKRATFEYINAAPQFARFNNGNWKKLEGHLQGLVRAAKGGNFTVYTGTYGQIRCPGRGRKELVFIRNSKEPKLKGVKIPIPKIFFKIIEPPQGDPIFVAVINDPHMNKGQIEGDSEARLCTVQNDVCEAVQKNSRYSWFKKFACDISGKKAPPKTQIKAGYMYMCAVTPGLKRQLGI